LCLKKNQNRKRIKSSWIILKIGCKNRRKQNFSRKCPILKCSWYIRSFVGISILFCRLSFFLTEVFCWIDTGLDTFIINWWTKKKSKFLVLKASLSPSNLLQIITLLQPINMRDQEKQQPSPKPFMTTSYCLAGCSDTGQKRPSMWRPREEWNRKSNWPQTTSTCLIAKLYSWVRKENYSFQFSTRMNCKRWDK